MASSLMGMYASPAKTESGCIATREIKPDRNSLENIFFYKTPNRQRQLLPNVKKELGRNIDQARRRHSAIAEAWMH
jgi:hypothetical protein